MKTILILNGRVINENQILEQDIFVKDGKINKIDNDLSSLSADIVIDASGKYVMPGMIDDQVHFREPGNLNKGSIKSEATAAVVGGVTSFFDMPNNNPPIVKNSQMDQKFSIAEQSSICNYAFYLGATNDNVEEIKNLRKDACGVKIFMGASTGNMLVDNLKTLEEIFIHSPALIATHCEDTPMINENLKKYQEKYGEDIPIEFHAEIGSREACIKSSSLATDLAKSFGSRLHVLHITTHDELKLFSNAEIDQKKITAEACIHHLLFHDADYKHYGSLIKCNPSIKYKKDMECLRDAVNSNIIDAIATDHAPHELSEKKGPYAKITNGIPYIQYALRSLLELHHDGVFTLEKIIEKVCHGPAKCYGVIDRGYIREGYWADITIFEFQDAKKDPAEVLHKCGWSPMSETEYRTKIDSTIVSGNLSYSKGKLVNPEQSGMKVEFSRDY